MPRFLVSAALSVEADSENSPEREPEFASAKELDMAFGPNLANPSRLEWLGTYTSGNCLVDIWDTGEQDGRGWQKLAYRLCWLDEEVSSTFERQPDPAPLTDRPVWEIIFTGEDFSPGAATGNEDLTLANLLGFLSAKPGDTDPEYFADYTPRQLEFANEHGEELALWCAELEGELGG